MCLQKNVDYLFYYLRGSLILAQPFTNQRIPESMKSQLSAGGRAIWATVGKESKDHLYVSKNSSSFLWTMKGRAAKE